MKNGLRKLILIGSAIALTATFAFSEISKVTRITGAAELGFTKQDVIKSLGRPDSPDKFDFYYIKKNSEVVVAFNDKTNLVESVIIKGSDPKYEVAGIKIGALKASVKEAFGNPEKVIKYAKSKIECWYYPSKNVNFAFSGDKVASFSISDVNIGK
jgi:outer membrane protein assembly factor BamE (lipoprotein component of BamABCDE complex)